MLLGIILFVHHQQLLPGDEDVYASVPNQQPFLDPRNLLLYNIPILARLLALPALHDGGGGGYQTHHNHGPCLKALHGDIHVQQLHRKVTNNVILREFTITRHSCFESCDI